MFFFFNANGNKTNFWYNFFEPFDKPNSKVTKKTETHDFFTRDKPHLEVYLDY